MTAKAPSEPALAELVRATRRLPAPAYRRALRVESGLSTAHLANELGVTRQTISNWECGRRSPRGARLTAYVTLLEQLRQLTQEAS